MRVLITGANGRLGTAFQAMLQNEDVFAYSKERLDCTKRSDFFHIVDSVNPDLILHCAAITNVDQCEKEPLEAYRVNSLTVQYLVEAARGRTLMLFSTDYVFSKPSEQPYLETDRPTPKSVYAYSKWLGEELVKHHSSVYVIRTSWLFGGKGDFVDKILQKVDQISPITVVDDQIGTPTYIKDLVKGALMLLQHPPGLYHLTNAGRCSRYEWANEIVSYVNNKVSIQPVHTSLKSDVAHRPSHTFLSTEKWKQVTGGHVRDWKEALQEYMEERLDESN